MSNTTLKCRLCGLQCKSSPGLGYHIKHKHKPPHGNKWCTRCWSIKRLDEFYTNKSRSTGYESYCKQCTRELNQVYRRGEKYKAYWRNWYRGRGRFGQSKANAKKRGIDWSIEKDDYEKLLLETCFYCLRGLNSAGIGLDRVDSLKGYDLNNVVPCCGLCNRIKSNVFSWDEMVTIGRVISEIMKARQKKSF